MVAACCSRVFSSSASFCLIWSRSAALAVAAASDAFVLTSSSASDSALAAVRFNAAYSDLFSATVARSSANFWRRSLMAASSSTTRARSFSTSPCESLP